MENVTKEKILRIVSKAFSLIEKIYPQKIIKNSKHSQEYRNQQPLTSEKKKEILSLNLNFLTVI